VVWPEIRRGGGLGQNRLLTSYQHLGVRILFFLALYHQICDSLLEQPQETNVETDMRGGFAVS
jgi:hypothetical protein